MNVITSIAWKDIRLLFSDRLAAFFVLLFPIIMGLFFGSIMNVGSRSGIRNQMKVVVVDLDQSDYSQALLENLKRNGNLALEDGELEEARLSVQGGKRMGLIVIPQGFGQTAGVFWEEPQAIQLGIDPARTAEGAMLEGFLMEAMGGLFAKRFSQPASFLKPVREAIEEVQRDPSLGGTRRENLLSMYGTLTDLIDSIDRVQKNEETSANDSNSSTMPEFKLAAVERIDVTRVIDPESREGQIQKIRQGWDISFPQAMLWGVLSCAASFAISLAQERENGTLVRLQVAPISRGQILSGKAFACFSAILFVILMMTALGLALGMRPLSYPKLICASLAVSFCFVGIMMLLSTVGQSVQSVSGIGWASNMIMAMFGGCMIPVMFMPEFISRVSVLSPVRWAILSLEGAIWRDFNWAELGANLSVLIGVGLSGLIAGIWNHQRKN
jgi:ABC-2 type transport system permease protein